MVKEIDSSYNGEFDNITIKDRYEIYPKIKYPMITLEEISNEDGYLKGEKYVCLRRIGDPAIAPLSSDNNVMTGYLRYECNLDIKTNTIYRRY